MINGVIVKPLRIHKDIIDEGEVVNTPGFLLEVVRNDEGLLKKFGQSTMTVAYEGTIKAFHWHKNQDDIWFVATGKAMVVLHDLRKDSPTHRKTQVIFAGSDDYKVIVIPIGVAHGYKVISKDPVTLFYHTTLPYNINNPDEKRIRYDDPLINFNWNETERYEK